MADSESRKLWENLKLGYTHSRGNPRLRSEISRLYRHRQSEEIIVTVPEEGIFLYMNTVLNPGDHIVVTWPGYQSLYEIARARRCRVLPWTPREDAGWRFHTEDLEKLLTPKTRVLVLNFPHNPTGALLTGAELESIVRLCDRNDILIFSDEMYRFLETGRRPIPSLADLSPRAVCLGGLSKAFSLPGLRIGWLAGSDRKLLDRLVALKDYTTICHSAPSEILALTALRAGTRILRRNRDRIRKNIRTAEEFFRRYPEEFHFIPPAAGPVALVRLEGYSSASAFCEELRIRRGVLLLPSTLFEFGDHHLRFGLGRKEFAGTLAKVDAFLQEYPPSRLRNPKT